MDLSQLDRLIARRAFLRSSTVLGVGSTAFNALLAEENVKVDLNKNSDMGPILRLQPNQSSFCTWSALPRS